MTEEDKDPRPPSPAQESSSRTRRVYDSAQGRGTEAYERGRFWIENQDPASRKGATIGWVRRYQAADGQLYAVLLSAYLFLGLVGMRIISGLLLKHWLEWYSKTYGALGIVMAMFFWIILAATILVLAAALSPALAYRRDLRRAGTSKASTNLPGS